MNALKKKAESFGFEENPVPADRYQDIIGQGVRGKIDRPMGSCHPRHKNIFYPVNYGYVTGITGGDGAIRSDVTVPGDDEIYAQIAFQEQFLNGVLVG